MQEKNGQKAAASSSRKPTSESLKTITVIIIQIHNAQLLNCIQPEENSKEKSEDEFWRNQSTTSQIIHLYKQQS